MGTAQGENEQERLNALHNLRILEAEDMPEVEALVAALATIFDAPMAFLSFVDKDELWFKARHGVTTQKTLRIGSFCEEAIRSGDLMVVRDALKDDRFRNSRLVVAGPGTRFYAGFPLSLDGKNRLGTLCVVDTKPRDPNIEQLDQLRRLGAAVQGLLKSYRMQQLAETARREAEDQRLLAERESELLEEVTSASGVGGWEYDIESGTVTWTRKTCEIHEVDEGFRPTVDMALSFYAPECRRQISDAVTKAIRTGDSWDLELPFVTAKGRKIWVRSAGRAIGENGHVQRLVGAFQDITERKSSEQLVRRTEAIQRTTLETLREGILVLSRAGRIQSFNAAAAKLLDRAGEDLKGKNVQELDIRFRTEDGAEDPDVLTRAVVEPNSINNHVVKLNRLDGSRPLWLRIDANATDCASREDLDAVVISLADISVTKRQAETLQVIFDNLPGGLVYYNDERYLTVCNQAFQDLLRLPQEFIDRGAALREIATFLAERGDYGPGDPEKLVEDRFRQFDDPKPHVYERSGADGRYLEVRGIPLPNGGLIANFFDISERKRSEQRLRQSEAVQRTTLEALSEGILLLSHSGEIQSVNPAAIGLLGLEGRQLVGMNVSDIDFGISCEIDGAGACSDPLGQAARDPSRLQNVIARMARTEGRSERWLRLSARPIDEDQEFELDGVVVSLTDITATKQQADTLQSIFDNFPGGIVHYDDSLHVLSSNDEFRRLLGYPKDLIDSRPHILDFFRYNAERGDYGPGDPDELAQARFRLYDPTKPQVFERRAANGGYIETRSRPLPSGGFIHNFYDITERKQLEAQLAENERQARLRSDELEAILANMRQGVSVFDERGRLALWNQQYIEIFDKPSGEVKKGAPLIELIKAEKDRGEFEGDVTEHVMDLMIRLSAGEVVRSKFKHPSGKIISAVHAPMPGGGWIGTHEDVTVREQAAEKIEYAAHHDMLTGLANRTLFNAKLDEALNVAAATGNQGDLLLLDLDKFKPVNDTHGHDAGDELLRQVAQRLRDCVRSSDLVARLGGDEFGIILSGTGSSNSRTAEIADRIVSKLSAPFTVLDKLISIGVSVGIAPINGYEIEPGVVFKRADLALYQVKANGRNGFRFHEEDAIPLAARA
jgi:diguanylate cyclase (GGDEF)-like protein/PAS domain S-box-containing protein